MLAAARYSLACTRTAACPSRRRWGAAAAGTDMTLLMSWILMRGEERQQSWQFPRGPAYCDWEEERRLP